MRSEVLVIWGWWWECLQQSNDVKQSYSSSRALGISLVLRVEHYLLHILPGCVCLSRVHLVCSTMSWYGAWHVSAYTSEMAPRTRTSRDFSLSMSTVPSRITYGHCCEGIWFVINVEADRAGACTRIGQRDARMNKVVHAPSPTNKWIGQCCSDKSNVSSPELDIYQVSCRPNLGPSTTLVTACISTLSYPCHRQQQASHAASAAILSLVIQSDQWGAPRLHQQACVSGYLFSGSIAHAH